MSGAARRSLVEWAHSMFGRGLTSGSSGNVSIRTEDGWLISPTNCCLGTVQADDLVAVDGDWRVRGPGAPSKEWPLHAAMYRARPHSAAVVHLHSPYAVALSCLDRLDPAEVLPPLTPYFVMRVAPLGLVAYRPPGDTRLADEVRAAAERSHTMLLRNHGSLAAGRSLEEAVFAAEELEQTARIWWLLGNRPTRTLSPGDVARLLDPPSG